MVTLHLNIFPTILTILSSGLALFLFGRTFEKTYRGRQERRRAEELEKQAASRRELQEEEDRTHFLSTAYGAISALNKITSGGTGMQFPNERAAIEHFLSSQKKFRPL